MAVSRSDKMLHRADSIKIKTSNDRPRAKDEAFFASGTQPFWLGHPPGHAASELLTFLIVDVIPAQAGNQRALKTVH
jgi:hypothetical protein